MLTVDSFGTHFECEYDSSKKTFTSWFYYLITDDHIAADLFWSRVDKLLSGEPVDIGSLPPAEQHTLWEACSHGIV
jgi:hypothetical protein